MSDLVFLEYMFGTARCSGMRSRFKLWNGVTIEQKNVAMKDLTTEQKELVTKMFENEMNKEMNKENDDDNDTTTS